MVRQSCAIGACDEKTYRHSDGVKFFYLRRMEDSTKRVWKRKILETRRDITEVGDGVAICSRHFVDGDKRYLPTIIPRKVDGEIVWPKQSVPRRCIRRQLELQSEPSLSTESVDTDNGQVVNDENSPPISTKLKRIREAIDKSPEPEIKDLSSKRKQEVDLLSPEVRMVFARLDNSTTSLPSPPLSKKLKVMKAKLEREPEGIQFDSVQKTPNIKDSLILRLQKELIEEKKKSKALELELTKRTSGFGIERFKGNPYDFSFYTGIQDYMTFLSFCDFLQPERHVVSSLYYDCKDPGSSYVNVRGREPILSTQDQLFLVLCRLRQGYRELDLSHRFNISTTTVSCIFSKWVKHMAHILDQLPTWASRAVIDENMPQAFTDINYQATRCIVDCTEIFIQQPSSNLAMQSVLFSTYKNHHTAKALHTGEKPYQCNLCSKAFSHSSHLTSHKRTHTGEKPYQCDICNKTFNQSGHLITHKRIHSGDKPYQCDLCDKTFSQLSSLTYHKRIHTGDTPYQCDQCSKTFTTSSNLTKHKTVHTGEKPYHCAVCRKAFSLLHHLRRHKRTHTGDKLYKCGQCGKAFSQSSHLTRQKTIHTGEKPYQCDLCSKSFNQSSNLTQHKKIHTKDQPTTSRVTARSSHIEEKPYTCDTCRETFRDMPSLTKHIMQHNIMM